MTLVLTRLAKSYFNFLGKTWQVLPLFFIGMAAILAGQYPQKTPELFANMRRIVNTARKYEGSTWITNDRVYQRQVASVKAHPQLVAGGSGAVQRGLCWSGKAMHTVSTLSMQTPHYRNVPGCSRLPLPLPGGTGSAEPDAGSPATRSGVQQGTLPKI